jgi:hypothetical protein
MYPDEDVATLIENENTAEGRAEIVRQLEELLARVVDNTDAADEKSRLRLRVFTKRC